MLPKGCIAAIESLCARFFWSGNIEKKEKAKIAWDTVCLPKKEGGLGIRSIQVWNQVLGLKFIWLLLSRSPSLWSDWHTTEHLSTCSFWEITPSQTDSWAWKKILQLHPIAIQFCKTVVGNGRNASFWFDVWTPLGQLIKILGSRGPRALRLRKEAKVADAISHSRWNLPHPRSQQEVDLHTYLTTISLPLSTDVDDVFEWQATDYPLNVFNSQATWEILRPRQPDQPWHDVVWFKGAVPKHAFTMWVTNYDRLPTRTRLAAWGLTIPDTCPLCASLPETRDHLFLSCRYTYDIWSQAPLSDVCRKLAVQAVIFQIWKQRNNLIHNNAYLPPSSVFRAIDREIRNIISSRRSTKQFNSLMVMWLV
ncbi:hypothetical protein Bca101_006501 [Brassica carinata]